MENIKEKLVVGVEILFVYLLLILILWIVNGRTAYIEGLNNPSNNQVLASN